MTHLQPAEPPCTDPYARWCDRESGRLPTYVDHMRRFRGAHDSVRLPPTLTRGAIQNVAAAAAGTATLSVYFESGISDSRYEPGEKYEARFE